MKKGKIVVKKGKIIPPSLRLEVAIMQYSATDKPKVELDNYGVRGYFSLIFSKDWFRSAFGNPDVIDSVVWRSNHQLVGNGNDKGISKGKALRLLGMEIAHSMGYRWTSPQSNVIIAYLFLRVEGKTAFSRLMKFYAQNNVNWRPIANMNSVEGQIVALKLAAKNH